MENIEFLVSTMDCENTSELYEKMNIKSNAMIINQTNFFGYNEKIIKSNTVKSFHLNERGIGLSRNTALMRSTGDICVISDDDMVYDEDCLSKILDAYKKFKDADMIVFDVTIKQDGKERHTVKKNGKVHLFNCLRYGAVCFTFKKESINKENIFFSQLFGGGSKYGSGEDSIFIWEVLKNRRKVYAVNSNIATVYNDDSSWFTGYNDKFFFDRGALFYKMSPLLSKLLCIQFVLRHRKKYINNISSIKAYKQMKKGIKEFKQGE